MKGFEQNGTIVFSMYGAYQLSKMNRHLRRVKSTPVMTMIRPEKYAKCKFSLILQGLPYWSACRFYFLWGVAFDTC
jgi:hypothetical protein